MNNAEAATLSPDPSCCIPAGQKTFLQNADQGPNYARLTIWLSDQAPPPSNHGVQVINATEGQSSIPLTFSYAGAVGNTGNRAKNSRAKVVGAQNTSGLIGSTLTIGWGDAYQTVGAYDHDGKAFSYQPPGGATNGSHTIQVTIKQVIEYDNGVFECVTPSGVSPFQVSGADQIGSCPNASTNLTFYINAPPKEYDHRAQLLFGNGSPLNRQVTRNTEYTLYPRARNVGPEKSPDTHMLAVQSLNPNRVDPVIGGGGIGDLTPLNKRATIFGDLKGYQTNENACNPNNTTLSTCWAWGFKNLAPGNEVDSSFRFKVKANAPTDSEVCFLPFVRRRGVFIDVHQNNQECFTVKDTITVCPPNSEFAGQVILDLAVDQNGDGIRTDADCNSNAEKSYLSVYGNDVIAGGGFGSVCENVNDEATIESYASGSGTTWKGASSQLAAFALGSIENFYTGNMRGLTTSPQPPLDLTFGNTANGNSKVQMNGGGFSGHTNCIPDYFANRGNSPVLTGDQTIATRNIADGTKDALYYQGDVLITGDGISFNNTNWSNVASIPSFYLIVQGNIFIEPGVKRLDGVYIAQPDENGDGGEIVTCAVGLRNFTPPHNACIEQLEINGTFIAKRVHFKRAHGTVTAALPNEGPGTSNAGEVFKFSPETYLSPLNSSLERSLPFTKYDYITSLPPIL